jgi:hypothetical protein
MQFLAQDWLAEWGYAVAPPIVIAILPWLLARYVFVTKATRQLPYWKYGRWLVAVAITWFVAFLVPNPSLAGDQTNSLAMHFTGGLAATMLFFFVMKAYNIRFTAWRQPLVALYFFASGLGVANELMEMLLYEAHILDTTPPSLFDTWWDLCANTAGAFTCLAVLTLAGTTKRSTK